MQAVLLLSTSTQEAHISSSLFDHILYYMVPTPNHRTFNEQLKLRKQISDGLRSRTYEATSASGKPYFVKIYKPYDEDKALDRVRLERRGLSLSDELLNAYFDPFRRERRVYERLDRRTTGLERTFFLEYYGDIQIPNSAGSDSSDSRMIVLELLQNRRPVVQKELSLTDDLISRAKQLRSNMDDEGVHCLIHLYEIFDALHRFEIIHSDIKPDMLADYLVAGRPVLYDFSESWAYKKGFHRLDPFKNHPRYFDEDRKRELNDIDRMVLKDNKAPPEKKELRRKFPAIKECGRCEKVLADIIGEQ